jgi:hypothetical protein
MKSLRIVAGSIVSIALLVSSGRAERVGITQTWVDNVRPLAYRIEGGSHEFRATGEICSLMQSFVVAGGGVKVKFTPKSSRRGRYDYSGKVGGVEVGGRGTYEVQYDGRFAFGIVATSSDAGEKTEFYRLEQVQGACRG